MIYLRQDEVNKRGLHLVIHSTLTQKEFQGIIRKLQKNSRFGSKASSSLTFKKIENKEWIDKGFQIDENRRSFNPKPDPAFWEQTTFREPQSMFISR
ncbi:hypothetical protein JXM67_14595 [candidate division WOR-3 bacterium]|nr:hypothetical protein [candidate division WOR-3 bacterium]